MTATVPAINYRTPSTEELSELKKLQEQPRPSQWQSRDGALVTPSLLPLIFGAGDQPVTLSFYHDPETVIIILFDASLPLDLDLPDRCHESETIRCFRDAIDQIYDACEDTWDQPPGLTESSIPDLQESASFVDEEALDDDDGPSLWDLVLRGGGTWCHA
jgi:hypothetical protein